MGTMNRNNMNWTVWLKIASMKQQYTGINEEKGQRQLPRTGKQRGDPHKNQYVSQATGAVKGFGVLRT